MHMIATHKSCARVQSIKKELFKMKKHLLMLALSATFGLSPLSHAKTAFVPPVPEIAGTAFLIEDVQSGQILGQKNLDERIEPASLTKLMTAYLTFKALNQKSLSMDQELYASEVAWKTEGSRMFLDPKVPVTVSDLIKGMIVQSGNDACVTLAEAIAGSEAGFAVMMNEQARQLGMNNTNFENSTGLPGEQHYTTVRDLATLSSAIMTDFPEHYKLYSIKDFTYNNIKQLNRNLLLYRDASVDGLKTGHTDSAGYNLIASSNRNGRRVLSVVVGTASSEARANESSKLLNWALQAFETPKIYDAKTPISKIRVYKGASNEVEVGFDKAVYVTVARGQTGDIKPTLETIQPLVGPIKAGQKVGTLKIMVGDEVVATKDVVALKEIAEAGFFGRLWDTILLWFK